MEKKQRVYCCGVGYLGDTTWGCHGGARGFIYRPENTTTAVTNESDSFCWTGHVPVYLCCTTVCTSCTRALNCEVARWWVHVPLLACKACAPHRNYSLACVFTASFLLLASQLSSSSCCGRCTCVTLWGRCRRRSTSLATWPSLFTMKLSCQRYSISSGNSSSPTVIWSPCELKWLSKG